MSYSTRRPIRFAMKKTDTTTRTSSPPLPLTHEVLAAATTHAGRFRRAPAPRSTPPSSPWSAPPSPPSRFSAPGLYQPLATPPPWLGFLARVRRRVSGGPRVVPPSILAGICHLYTSPSLHILCCRCRCSTPWEFPIHHGGSFFMGDVMQKKHNSSVMISFAFSQLRI